MPRIPFSKDELYHDAPCGYFTIDKQGIIIHMNQTGLELLGYQFHELINKKCLTDILVHPAPQLNFKKYYTKNQFVELLGKNGNKIPVILYYRKQRWVFVDRRAEQQLTLQLLKKEEQVSNLGKEKDYFTGIASHDLLQPLSVIINMSESILKYEAGALTTRQQQIAGFIYKASLEMKGMIQHYLTFCRIESGVIQFQPVKFNITGITKGIAERYRELASKKNITVSFYSKKDYFIETDLYCFEQILNNLVSNAVKYTQQGKKIYIILSQDADFIQIAVKDEGAGIPSSEIPLLFKKFTVLSTKPTGGESATGLGLSMVKFLVDQIGASIAVKSSAGRGSCFTVRFPSCNKSNC